MFWFGTISGRNYRRDAITSQRKTANTFYALDVEIHNPRPNLIKIALLI
jgi:hypothetical protein